MYTHDTHYLFYITHLISYGETGKQLEARLLSTHLKCFSHLQLKNHMVENLITITVLLLKYNKLIYNIRGSNIELR